MIKIVNTDILKMIQNINQIKAHGHDKTNIWMLKKWGNSLCRPQELIFNDCLANGIFPSDWKKGNMVLDHKKNYIQRLNNYRPISLLQICSRISSELYIMKCLDSLLKISLNISQYLSTSKYDTMVLLSN